MKVGNKMVKAIVFDLDGTLLNTVEDIKYNLNNTLKEYNYQELTSNEVKAFLGNGSKALVTKALKEEVSEDLLNEITKRYTDLYNDPSSNKLTKPYDGIMALINDLKALNIKVAITSNKMQEGVTALNNSVFNGLMDVSIGEGQGIPLKPNPLMIYKALEIMGVNKDEALFVGDTEVDLLAASNANMKSVAVTWGFRTKEFLSTLDSNYIIDEPSELIDIINNINLK